MLDTIRITERTKRHLSAVKRATGIEHWNILCRWSFCLSLSLAQPMNGGGSDDDLSNVEMTWRTFAGQRDKVYWAILKNSYERSSLDIPIATFLRRHLLRGASQLAAEAKANGPETFLELPVHLDYVPTCPT